MEPTHCPHCQIRVLPSPEGICPGCRKVISTSVQVAPPVAKECPECRAPLVGNASLCVACGYHLPRAGFSTTAEELRTFTHEIPTALLPTNLQPPDSNPYTSPGILMKQPVVAQFIGEPFVADLTPHAAKRARAIVVDAEHVYLALILSLCVCGFAWFLLFPWYSYRLYSWYELNSTYSELRNPNPRLSDHYGLAQDFQAAKGRMWSGFIIGAICLSLGMGFFAISVL